MFEELFLRDLSQAERNALHSYKAADDAEDGQSKCFDLNRELRNGLRVDELSDELRQIAVALDRVFERCPTLKTSATVFRGIGERRFLPVHEEGSRFRNLQYWSTTIEEEKTESFMTPSERPGYGAVLELKLPEGFPAYNMETLDGFGGHEGELLVPRCVLWRVESCHQKKIGPFLARYFANVAHVVLVPEKWSK